MVTPGRNGNGNGTVWKWVSAALLSLLMASVVWIWNAGGKTMSVIKDVQSNKESIVTVTPVVYGNRESIIGISKDVDRLNEKMVEFSTEQKVIRTEQQKSFRAILERLPE